MKKTESPLKTKMKKKTAASAATAKKSPYLSVALEIVSAVLFIQIHKATSEIGTKNPLPIIETEKTEDFFIKQKKILCWWL